MGVGGEGDEVIPGGGRPGGGEGTPVGVGGDGLVLVGLEEVLLWGEILLWWEVVMDWCWRAWRRR